MALRWMFLMGQMIVFSVGLLMGTVLESQAAERSGSNYFLGKGGPMAGVMPPPGVYIRDDLYSYSGDSDDILLDSMVTEQDVSVASLMNIFSLCWVTDLKLLGGSLGLGAGFAYGTKEYKADYALSAGFLSFDQQAKGDTSGFSDIGVGASLGWHKDSSHWIAYSSVVFPIGDYEEDRVANMGNNRWCYDVGAGYTYLNIDNGFEASAMLGLAFSGENPDTGYQPGMQYHIEAALIEHLPNRFSFGIAGYYYEQFTEDSGVEGLDDIMGRLAGAGPTVGYYFVVAETLFSVNVRWYHEFAAEYSFEGDTIFGTIGIAL